MIQYLHLKCLSLFQSATSGCLEIAHNHIMETPMILKSSELCIKIIEVVGNQQNEYDDEHYFFYCGKLYITNSPF